MFHTLSAESAAGNSPCTASCLTFAVALVDQLIRNASCLRTSYAVQIHVFMKCGQTARIQFSFS